jgi:Domain of unknown function (DUF6268)
MYYIQLRRNLLGSLASGILAVLAGASVFAGTEPEMQQAAQPADKNSRDLFSYDGVYTFRSDFKNEPRLGEGDSLYNDFSYDHRFLITGKWYFRTGFEYERYDFGGTDNGLPDLLQAIYGHLAIEYVVKDHAGASLEIDPGVYFQNRITGDAFDIPWKIFVSFPLKKDKIFGVIGLGGALYQDPIVAPGGGLIWLFTNSLRLEGVFPKPALVYNLNDDWEFRIAANLAYESFRTDDVFTPLHKLREHNAVVQYHETRAGLQVSYSGIKHLKITAAAGYTIVRDFDFFRVGLSERTDPAPYVQLSAEAKF